MFGVLYLIVLQVEEILGSSCPWKIVLQNMDCMLVTCICLLESLLPMSFNIVPELQGEPEEIVREKCRLAAAKVCFYMSFCCL